MHSDERCIGDCGVMVELITSNPRTLETMVTYDESRFYYYEAESKTENAQWKLLTPKKNRQSKSTGKLMMIPFLNSKELIYIYYIPSGQTVNNEYFVQESSRRDFIMKGQSSSFCVSGTCIRIMHLSTLPFW